jgi:hypothetical protein
MMDLKRTAAAAALLGGVFAVAAHAQWSGAGWGVGHGGGSELGRVQLRGVVAGAGRDFSRSGGVEAGRVGHRDAI